jgi:hypothetical protein
MTENLLLEPHPARKIPTTPKLEIAVTRKIPTLKSRIDAPLFHGMKAKAPTEPIRTRNGAMNVKQLICLVYRENFLDKHLHYIGKNLEDTPWTYSHRTQTALKISADFTFHKYKCDSQEGVCCKYKQTYDNALNKD